MCCDGLGVGSSVGTCVFSEVVAILLDGVEVRVGDVGLLFAAESNNSRSKN